MTDTDEHFEMSRRRVLIMDHARRVIKSRRNDWDHPAKRWYLTESRYPGCTGIYAFARLSASEDGTGYTVKIYPYNETRSVWSKQYKGLMPALKAGIREVDNKKTAA